MKTKFTFAALALLWALDPQASRLRAQGSLTPPGAPGPTMKTLGQVEPRTPISTAPFTISVSGSYYLATNLTVVTGNGITIATSGVSVDLNGFTISSTAPSPTGFGIQINTGLRDIIIANGFVRGGVTNNAGTYAGPGFQQGISFSGVGPVNTRVTGVSVSGCLSAGIRLAPLESTVVESCTVRTVGGGGIIASTVRGSVAVECGGDAIWADQVSDSRGEATGNGYGIHGGQVHNSFGSSEGGTGIYAIYTVQNSQGRSGTGKGIDCDYSVQNCYAYSASGPCALQAGNASFCTAYRSGGRAIWATVATGCYTANGTNLITHKYNMP